jgi:peptidylprolyl isomerase
MTQAKNGTQVSVHYKGTLNDGSVFDESNPERPLEFTVGGGQVIPGFDKAVEGMNVGDSKTVTLEADQAYGQHRDELVMKVDRGRVPKELDIEVGQRYQMEKESGEKFKVTVTEVTESSVTLDANHPLAGQDLTFEIKLVDVKGTEQNHE